MANVAIDRVRCRVGFASSDTARITVMTFNEKPVRVTCSGGTVQVSPLVALGSGIDHFGVANGHMCHAGLVTISGLSAFSRYTYQVEHEGETLAGSFWTLPSDDITPYSIALATCDDAVPRSIPLDRWNKHFNHLIQTTTPRVIAYAHIDDIGYPDQTMYAVMTDNKPDPDTGFDFSRFADSQATLCFTRASRLDQAQDALIMGWMFAWGMFPRLHPWPASEWYQWRMRNVAHWDQLGDHEFWGDARSQVGDAQGNGGVHPELQVVHQNTWNLLFGQAGPPKLRADENYWGIKVGPCRFVSYDRVTHALPYDAADNGNTHEIADPNSDWFKTAQGATAQTLFDYGLASNAAPTRFLGDIQVNDVLNFLNAAEPFKWVLSSNGISGHNQPWADWWPSEWADFLTRKSEYVVNGTFGPGATAWMNSIGTSFSINNDTARITLESGQVGHIHQRLHGLSPNQDYRLKVTCAAKGPNGAAVRVGHSEDDGSYLDAEVEANQTLTTIFSPQISNPVITLRTIVSGAPAWVDWRNVSVQKAHEFVRNGDINAGTLFWSSGGPAGAAITIDNRRMLVTSIGAAAAFTYQRMTELVVGEVYEVKINFNQSLSSTQGQLRIGTSAGAADLLVIDAIHGDNRGTFVATGDEAWIALANASNSPGAFTSWRNASVKGPHADANALGVGRNPNCNGELGHIAWFTGDVHTASLKSFRANGTSGLGYEQLNTNNAGQPISIWEFSSGTLSSATGRLNKRLIQGGRLLWQHGARSRLSDRQISVALLLSVHANESPKRQTVTYHDLLQEKVLNATYVMTNAQLDNEWKIDTDGDGLTDDVESSMGTSPSIVDSDGDGVSDFDEVNVDGNPTTYFAGVDTNPLSRDTDGDGILDGQDSFPNGEPAAHQVPIMPWPFSIAAIVGATLMAIRRRKNEDES